MACLPFETLVAFAEGTLDAATVPTVSSHLAGCASCRDPATWLRKTIDTMRANDLQDPPREAVDRLIDYFKKVRAKSRGESVPRLIEAHLLFDSRQPLEFSGARNVQGSGKQLLYQADHYDIDIRFNPADVRVNTHIIGQVLAHEDNFDQVSGIPVHLYAHKEVVLSTLTDQIGVFHLRQVPQGLYDFKISPLDCEITIRGISVSAT